MNFMSVNYNIPSSHDLLLDIHQVWTNCGKHGYVRSLLWQFTPTLKSWVLCALVAWQNNKFLLVLQYICPS